MDGTRVALNLVVASSPARPGRNHSLGRIVWGSFSILILAIALGSCTRSAAESSSDGSAAPEGGSLLDRESYYAVDVVDADHAWVVGSYGTVLHLTAGGSKPVPQRVPTWSSLLCVSFRTAESGLIGGERGLLLRTADGGEHWERVEVPGLEQNLLAIARGRDPRRVWAVGPMGTILHSSDDGRTWEDRSLGRDVNLNAVTFLDDHEGWVVGEFATILHTTDGGRTWERRDEVSGLPEYAEDITEEEARRRGIPRLEKEDLYFFGVAFRDRENGYVIGAGGFVLETIDGGEHWRVVVSGTRNTLFTLALSPNDRALAAGVLGTVIERENGGWRLDAELSRSLFTWIRAIDFSPDRTLAVGAGGNGTILVSRDEGGTWQALSPETLAAATAVETAPSSRDHRPET
jgi:photosystem II stability/assembly factor-like uncharacterized protein